MSYMIDGRTGELIGQGYQSGGYSSTTRQGYTTATGQQQGYYSTTPVYTQNTYTQNTYTGNTGAYTGGYNYAVGSAYSGNVVNGGYTQEEKVVNTTVNTGKEVIKGESRIEYVPFEKKVIDYKDQVKVQRVPRTRKVTEYREEKRVENQPREVTKVDYYAVEYLRQYIPQLVPEKTIEYVAKERKVKKIQYIPVERQIVHYPEQELAVESASYSNYPSYSNVPAGYTTNTYNQNYTTSYPATSSQYVSPQAAGGSTYYSTGGQYVSGNQYVTGGSKTQVTGGSRTRVNGGSGVAHVAGGSNYYTNETVTYEQPRAGGSNYYTNETVTYEQPRVTREETVTYTNDGHQIASTYSRDGY